MSAAAGSCAYLLAVCRAICMAVSRRYLVATFQLWEGPSLRSHCLRCNTECCEAMLCYIVSCPCSKSNYWPKHVGLPTLQCDTGTAVHATSLHAFRPHHSTYCIYRSPLSSTSWSSEFQQSTSCSCDLLCLAGMMQRLHVGLCRVYANVVGFPFRSLRRSGTR